MGIFDDGFDPWAEDSGYGIDTNNWMGGEDLPSAPLNSTSTSPLGALVTGSNGNGSTIQKILASLKGGGGQQAMGQNTKLPDLSSILGAFSQGEKANRLMQGNFTQDYDKSMLAAQAARNTNESDALKKLGQTSYIMGGGSQFKSPTLSLNGKTYNSPDLGFGPQAVTDAEKRGASTLQSQLQARLSPGGSYTPQPLDDYAKPGLAENLSSYGAAGLGGISALSSMFPQGGGGGGDSTGGDGAGGVGSALAGISKGIGTAGTTAGLLSKLGVFGKGGADAASAGTGLTGAGSTMMNVLGKAVPIAGAATGLYGLAKNNSVGSDVMSGAGTGASIGSMFLPGIGTGIGAGIGALAGGLRGLFSVTGKEQSGRDAQTGITNGLASQGTPQQQAEAAKAGWADPKQALSLIVMRDNFTKSGMDPQMAEQKAEAAMNGMWGAEKSGSDAVAQSFSPMQSFLQQQGNSPTAQGNGVSNLYGSGGLITDAFSKGARG